MIETLLPLLPIGLGMVIAGALGGLLAGLLGVGGGIIVVPVLFTMFELLDVDPSVIMHLAVGTSFAAMIPTALVSARSHWRKGAVDTAILLKWGPAAVFGCVLGVVFAGRVESAVLIWVFAASALFVAAYMLFSSTPDTVRDRMPGRLGAAAGGGTVGFVSSLMGIGGGTFFVPLFTALGTAVHRAVGSSAALGVAISIPGFIGFAWAGWGIEALPQMSFGFVNVMGALIVMPVSSLCAPLGAKLAHRLKPRTLKICFGVFLTATAAKMFLSTL